MLGGLNRPLHFHARALEFTGLPESRIINAAIENVAFSEAQFDFITFGAVFEHLYHPRECLEKALFWLKPGGILHVKVPSSSWLIETIYHNFLKAKGSGLTSFLSPMHSPYHLYSFSKKSFEMNQAVMGFRLLDSRIDPCQIFYFPVLLKSFVFHLMRITGTGMQLTIYLQKC